MKNNIEIVAPDLKITNGAPAICAYSSGQTIGYINYTSEGYQSSLYVRILNSTPKCIIPVIPIDAEFIDIINRAIESAENVSFDWVGEEQVSVSLTQFCYNKREGNYIASIIEDGKQSMS